MVIKVNLLINDQYSLANLRPVYSCRVTHIFIAGNGDITAVSTHDNKKTARSGFLLLCNFSV